MGNTNTYVANGTGKPIRVYYNKGKMDSALDGNQFYFRTGYNFIDISVDNYRVLAGMGAIHVSVYVQSENNSSVCKAVVQENYSVASDRSIIVTDLLNIVLQEYGSDPWTRE